MVVDATSGLIDNSELLGMGYTRVEAGTRFRLPALYGTIFTLVGANAFTATTIDGEVPEKGRQGDLYTATIIFAKKDWEWFSTEYKVHLDNGMEVKFDGDGLPLDVDMD